MVCSFSNAAGRLKGRANRLLEASGQKKSNAPTVRLAYSNDSRCPDSRVWPNFLRCTSPENTSTRSLFSAAGQAIVRPDGRLMTRTVPSPVLLRKFRTKVVRKASLSLKRAEKTTIPAARPVTSTSHSCRHIPCTDG